MGVTLQRLIQGSVVGVLCAGASPQKARHTVAKEGSGSKDCAFPMLARPDYINTSNNRVSSA